MFHYSQVCSIQRAVRWDSELPCSFAPIRESFPAEKAPDLCTGGFGDVVEVGASLTWVLIRSVREQLCGVGWHGVGTGVFLPLGVQQEAPTGAETWHGSRGGNGKGGSWGLPASRC